MKKSFIMVLLFGLMAALILTGCQGTSKKPLTPVKKPSQIQTAPDGQMTDSERRVLADKLARVSESVTGVQKASVVVMDVNMSDNMTTKTGTTSTTGTNKVQSSPGTVTRTNAKTNNDGILVMVGLTLNSSTNTPAMIAKTKSMVAQKIKASDKRISQVLVTTDPNLIKRISDIAAGIIEGKPVQSYKQDVRALNARLKQEKAVY